MANSKTQTNSKLRIVFLGTPKIGADVLNGLLRRGLPIAAVITQPDRPCGRGCKVKQSEVKEIALENNIEIFQPASKAELTKVIEKIKPDLGIVAAYGMMIPNEALEAPKYGMINFHPSLLPELRGPSPIPMAIMCGHRKTGVSIIQVSEKMDAGDIVAQRDFALTGRETTPTLSENLANLGVEMLIEVVEQIAEGNLKPQAQDESKATFTPIVKKSDGEVIFGEYHAENIEQAARAFTPWPGIYTTWRGKRLEIIEPKVVQGTYAPGLVTEENGQIIIGSAKGAIAPGLLKLEGKRAMTPREFLCGYADFIGAKLK